MAASLTQLVTLPVAAFVCHLVAGQQLEGPESCNTSTEVWNPECKAYCEPTCTEAEPCSSSGGAPQGSLSARICRPKCNCKPGLIRATLDGSCVPRDRCGVGARSGLTCTRPNEEYQCGSACQVTCANKDKKCEIPNNRCNDAYYCVEGYARNSEGTCIPKAACKEGRADSTIKRRDIVTN